MRREKTFFFQNFIVTPLTRVLTTDRASNVTVIPGLEGKEGMTTKFGFDFLIKSAPVNRLTIGYSNFKPGLLP